MANTVEDVVNQALVEIGYPGRVGSIREGSDAATAALEVYVQTRDELLDAGQWPLARRANVPLTLLKGPPPNGGYDPVRIWSPTYPPPGWLYEYAYPDDMLTLRAVVAMPGMMPDLLPEPAAFRIDNDNSLVDRDGNAAEEKKVILTNVRSALAAYTAVVSDPRLWEPGFTGALIKALAAKLARRLEHDETLWRDETQAANDNERMAIQERG